MLRSHTSAMIPPALRRLAAEAGWRDVTLACLGIVYRRDTIDRLHTGTPHQLDLWRIVAKAPMTGADLHALIATVIGAALPGVAYRTVASLHLYTEAGRQIDVLVGDEWVEAGECGLAAKHVLAGAGLGPTTTGLAMGLGLDRLLMLRKGIPDIRLLRAADPRIARQLLDLAPYRPVSSHPPVTRDLSLAVPAGTDAETIGDRVRQVPGAEAVEQLSVLAETPVETLPSAAVHRLGARANAVPATGRSRGEDRAGARWMTIAVPPRRSRTPTPALSRQPPRYSPAGLAPHVRGVNALHAAGR